MSGGLIGLLAMLAILVAVNVIVGQVRLRADLTEEKLYTLSDGTRRILKGLEHDVTLKFFFNASSPAVPVFLKNYARQVEDLLAEYSIASRGRVTIEKYDPRPDSDEEEWAGRYGISGQQVTPYDPPVYLGLVVVSGEVEGTIPVLDPRTEELLEYNITRLIHRVCNPEKPVLGVMSTLPVLGQSAPRFPFPGQDGGNQPAWALFQDLRRDYTLREVPATAESIDADVQALVVVHPKDLQETTLYALDQFALRGGRLLVFVDPLSLTDLESQPQQNMYGIGQKASSDLGVLFNAWGVGYDPDKVLMDPRAVTRVRGAGNSVEDNPVVLSLRNNSLNSDDVLTAKLETLLMPFAGALSDKTADSVTFTPLINSSATAGLADSMTARFGIQALRSSFRPSGTPLALAARLTGTVKSAFPNGKPEGRKDGEADPEEASPEPAESHLVEGTVTVIIVADTDMLTDRFSVETLNFFGTVASRPMNDNINLLANSVEQVTGSADLIGIRSRGRFNRPFDRVEALEQKARDVWQAKEESLQKQLEDTQNQLRELQNQKDDSQRFILSDEQRRAIASFKDQEQRIRQELKEVRRSLRSDIERLGVGIKTVNIAMMPLAVVVFGISYGLIRSRRR